MNGDFVRIEYLGNDYFCFYFGDVKQNKTLELIISKYFENYLSEKTKKKKYISTLSYIFLNIFRKMKSIELDYDNDGLLLAEYNFSDPMIKKTGYILKFSYHKGNYFYNYGKEKITQSFLIEVMKYLETINYMKHENGNFSSYKPSFQYINWNKIYKEIYKNNREEILKILEKAIPKRKQSEIVIKEKNEEGEWVAIEDKIKINSLSRRKELVETRKYIKKLRNMYSEMNVELDHYNNGTDIQRKNILELYEMKYGTGSFRVETYNKNIDIRNNYLKNIFLPYRTYHLSGKKLSWGRVYGGMLDSYVSNIYKPLLKIDNEYSLSIDIKSSLIQFFILTECKNINNKQDFYYYENLEKFSLRREDIKLISQCFLYNVDILNAWRAYNQKCWINKEYTKISYDKWKNELIPVMREEKSYLFDSLFFNKEKCKSMIHRESNFIIELSKELMSNKIKHISCFDAVYVSYKNMENTLNIINDTSIRMFNKEINVDFDNETFMELVR